MLVRGVCVKYPYILLLEISLKLHTVIKQILRGGGGDTRPDFWFLCGIGDIIKMPNCADDKNLFWLISGPYNLY